MFINYLILINQFLTIRIDNNRGETAKVYKDNKGIYLDTGRYDKRFKDLKQLASWLNKNKYRYIGITLIKSRYTR